MIEQHIDQRPIWYIRGPFTRFEKSMKEIKRLARRNEPELKIIDSRYVDPKVVEEKGYADAPKLKERKVKPPKHVLELEEAKAEIEKLKQEMSQPSMLADMKAEIEALKKQLGSKEK